MRAGQKARTKYDDTGAPFQKRTPKKVSKSELWLVEWHVRASVRRPLERIQEDDAGNGDNDDNDADDDDAADGNGGANDHDDDGDGNDDDGNGDDVYDGNAADGGDDASSDGCDDESDDGSEDVGGAGGDGDRDGSEDEPPTIDGDEGPRTTAMATTTAMLLNPMTPPPMASMDLTTTDS